MKSAMKYSVTLALLVMLTHSYSQSNSATAYYHKKMDSNHILLLDCNVGYSYSGPHLFVDEVFSYKVMGDKIIRNFDPAYSLRQRIDTLVVKKKKLQCEDGLFFMRVSSKKRDELIEKLIQPSADAGFYNIFLERVRACKENQ